MLNMKNTQNFTSILLLVLITALMGVVGCTPEEHAYRLVFTSDRDGNEEIYIMNQDGTAQRNLTNNPANEWFPTSSPDGQQIAFASDRDGTVAFSTVLCTS